MDMATINNHISLYIKARFGRENTEILNISLSHDNQIEIFFP
jgi:hypothetical protein